MTEPWCMIVYIAAAGHDNKGQKPGWHLDLVEVTHLPSGKLYFFPCAHWLDLAQDDGKIVRVLKVSAPVWSSTVALVRCTAFANLTTQAKERYHPYTTLFVLTSN